MPSDNDKSESSFQEELVPAVFARSAKEAEQYRQLLEDHDIEAIIGGEDFEARINVEAVQGGRAHGLPVLVPETCLDEAGEVIANREDLDEFDLNDKADEEDEDEHGLDPGLDPEGEDPPEIVFDEKDAPDEKRVFDDDLDDEFL